MSGTISFRADHPDYLNGKYNDWVMVGFAGTDDGSRYVPLAGPLVQSVTIVNPADTCLRPDGSGVTGTTIEGRRHVYLGLCLLDKGHDGDHSSDVFYCDGPCNGTYPIDHPHVGNEDVTFCEECNHAGRY